jgi:hypothetical protein
MISVKTDEDRERVDCLVDGIVRVAEASAQLAAVTGDTSKLKQVLDALCDELLEPKTEAKIS